MGWMDAPRDNVAVFGTGVAEMDDEVVEEGGEDEGGLRRVQQPGDGPHRNVGGCHRENVDVDAPYGGNHGGLDARFAGIEFEEYYALHCDDPAEPVSRAKSETAYKA